MIPIRSIFQGDGFDCTPQAARSVCLFQFYAEPPHVAIGGPALPCPFSA
jgi:hypothetical protein